MQKAGNSNVSSLTMVSRFMQTENESYSTPENSTSKHCIPSIQHTIYMCHLILQKKVRPELTPLTNKRFVKLN
jgi:hypothetical protein